MEFFNIFSSWQVWITVVTVVLALYKYLTRNYGYWESKGVPSEKGYPFFGSEFSLFRKPMHELDMERAKKHGRIYGTYLFGGRVLNVADPDILRLILVKDFPQFVNRQVKRTHLAFFDKGLVFATNEDWKRIRSVVTPTFTTGKIKRMTVVIKEIAERFSQHVIEIATGEAIDMKKVFSRFSVDVLGACAFGVKFDSFKNPNHPFLVKSRRMFEQGALLNLFFFTALFLPKWMGRFKLYFMEKVGIKFFIDAATEIIQERRKMSNQAHVDFIQLMLDAKDGKNTESDKKELEEQSSAINQENKSPYGTWTKTLDEEEIMAQCAVFLLAGHDTIASAISFVAYALALNPKYQEILHQEIDEAWEKHGELDYDIINKLTYLNAIISETLRLYTVGTRMMRLSTEDYKIPNTEITIPKNCIVSIPLYALHHDPELFPNPEIFDPERFLPENKDNIKPFTYIPFGDGPRNCVAMRFALMEMKFCLAYLLRSVKFIATAETMKPLDPIVGTGAFQPKTMMIKPEKRVF